MSNFGTIICICGSVRFKETMMHEACLKTMAGFIVLMPNCLNHKFYHKNPLGIEAKKDLDRLHFKKIELCDYVLVVNEGGYIGESTAREIAYAEKLGKPVSYVFDHEEKMKQ